VIVAIGRYRDGVEVDHAQSRLVRATGTLTPDAVSLVRAMRTRAEELDSDFVWMALASPSREELERLGDGLGIPRLWIDDALNPRQRAKAELDPEGSGGLVVFKIVSYDEPTSSIETGQITMLVGPSFVVTVRLGPSGALGRVRAALEERPDLLAAGPLAAVHGIIDAIVDDYLEATDEIARDIDIIEEHVFSPTITDDSEAIYLLKRENLELRRAVTPLVPLAQEVVRGSLMGERAALRKEFKDVADHLLRAHDNVESAENLLMSMLQASFSRQSIQQNTDMRKMAAYAAMLAVPTAIAGIYGMNFENMPELSWTFGYPTVLTGMGLSLVLMFAAFKRSGWL
jgi:magnesium transporter